ncbi:hypothetical protein HK100_000832 [Physocladia obscura]|uniref:Protein YAE1 n=1 Tax=Physocladia obscura TaxID=109957 RepID=A0AAD5XFB8_9FUNG|nr:hypothetical protein HK100_000832 [Physocladia obscura]
MSDDWLESDDEYSATAHNNTDDREFLALQRIHGTIGYREGVIAGKEETMQEGFDAGYNAGFAKSLNLGISAGQATVQKLLQQKLKLSSETKTNNDSQ